MVVLVVLVVSVVLLAHSTACMLKLQVEDLYVSFAE